MGKRSMPTITMIGANMGLSKIQKGGNHVCIDYDEFKPEKRKKKIISLHKTRKTAEKALTKRQIELDKRVWECHTRIVWLHTKAKVGDMVTPDLFNTWAPDEDIPQGDIVPDGD